MNICTLELSIILPTYNERENIGIIIPKIEDVLKDIKHEIIVVDDNSPDDTAGSVLELNKKYGNIRIITRLNKKGIGSALREGYRQAKGGIILSSDADLSFPVEDMIRLVNGIKDGNDLVLGCRHEIKGSYYEIKGARTVIKGFISRLGNIILCVLSGTGVHDFSANFRAIKRTAWYELDIKENTNIMLFETIIKAKSKGMKIAEIPVSFNDRIYGKSKLKLSIEIPKFILKMGYYLLKYR